MRLKSSVVIAAEFSDIFVVLLFVTVSMNVEMDQEILVVQGL